MTTFAFSMLFLFHAPDWSKVDAAYFNYLKYTPIRNNAVTLPLYQNAIGRNIDISNEIR